MIATCFLTDFVLAPLDAAVFLEAVLFPDFVLALEVVRTLDFALVFVAVFAFPLDADVFGVFFATAVTVDFTFFVAIDFLGAAFLAFVLAPDLTLTFFFILGFSLAFALVPAFAAVLTFVFTRVLAFALVFVFTLVWAFAFALAFTFALALVLLTLTLTLVFLTFVDLIFPLVFLDLTGLVFARVFLAFAALAFALGEVFAFVFDGAFFRFAAIVVPVLYATKFGF